MNEENLELSKDEVEIITNLFEQASDAIGLENDEEELYTKMLEFISEKNEE